MEAHGTSGRRTSRRAALAAAFVELTWIRRSTGGDVLCSHCDVALDLSSATVLLCASMCCISSIDPSCIGVHPLQLSAAGCVTRRVCFGCTVQTNGDAWSVCACCFNRRATVLKRANCCVLLTPRLFTASHFFRRAPVVSRTPWHTPSPCCSSQPRRRPPPSCPPCRAFRSPRPTGRASKPTFWRSSARQTRSTRRPRRSCASRGTRRARTARAPAAGRAVGPSARRRSCACAPPLLPKFRPVFSPLTQRLRGQKENAGLAPAIGWLRPIQAKHCGASWGDLVTFAAVTSVEAMGGPKVAWRAGRVDSDAIPPDGRLPGADPDGGNPAAAASAARGVFRRLGLSDREAVALVGAHSVGRMHREASGYGTQLNTSGIALTSGQPPSDDHLMRNRRNRGGVDAHKPGVHQRLFRAAGQGAISRQLLHAQVPVRTNKQWVLFRR